MPKTLIQGRELDRMALQLVRTSRSITFRLCRPVQLPRPEPGNHVVRSAGHSGVEPLSIGYLLFGQGAAAPLAAADCAVYDELTDHSSDG